MEINKINLRHDIKTLEKFIDVYGHHYLRAYDSEKQNAKIKITETNKKKYNVISAYYHDDFVAVYVRKSTKKGKRSR